MPSSKSTEVDKRTNLHDIPISNLSQILAVDKAIRAMSYINSALRDPLKPTTCGKSLSNALQTIGFATYPPSGKHVAERSTLRASLYGFLMAVRTDDELEKTMQKMAECSCKTSSFHPQTSQPTPTSIWNDVQEFVAGAIAEVEPGMNSVHALPIHKGTSKVWPTCRSDLIPLGADQLVFNIVQWYRVFPDQTVTRLALHILRTCGTPVYGAFHKADVINKLFLPAMRSSVDEFLACTTPAEFRNLKSTILFMSLATSFLGYLPYFAMKARIPGVIAAYGEPVTHGAETKAVQLCSLMLYILGSPNLDKTFFSEGHVAQMRADAKKMGCVLFRRFKMDSAPGPPMRLHPSITDEDRTLQMYSAILDPFSRIGNALYTCRTLYICNTPGCVSCFTRPDVLLRNCTGCYTVRYCSQECQKKDWKETPHNHKNICKTISKIMAEFGPWKDAPLAPLSYNSSIPELQVRDADENRRDGVLDGLKDVIVKLVSRNTLSGLDMEFIFEWTKAFTDTDIFAGKEPVSGWQGYEDYKDLLQRVENSRLLRGPKGEFTIDIGPRSYLISLDIFD
ncbi:hypothetical protein BJ165DRAFT_741735 [Panaeolus papilionaceus]|nr:hypothetical protein BJ165DRAFT_741735 [Panaeolus papilionaceus]